MGSQDLSTDPLGAKSTQSFSEPKNEAGSPETSSATETVLPGGSKEFSQKAPVVIGRSEFRTDDPKTLSLQAAQMLVNRNCATGGCHYGQFDDLGSIDLETARASALSLRHENPVPGVSLMPMSNLAWGKGPDGQRLREWFEGKAGKSEPKGKR